MSKSDFTYLNKRNEPYDRPCKTCGAVKRDANGHDPCISELPGVIHACCGHGEEQGYVVFENGITLRGQFEFKHVQRTLRTNADILQSL